MRVAAESDIQNNQSASKREERGALKRRQKIFESISSNWTGLKVLVSFEEKRARRSQQLRP